jgi:hypothetical protein
MTVTSTNYSSLDEAWGENFNHQKPKKEKRKKIVDPICELYEMGNNSGYNENDLVSYANDYFEKYDKTKYQRAMNDENNDVLPHAPQSQEMRERPVRQVAISSGRNTYDVTDDDDVHGKAVVQRPMPRTIQRVEKPQESFRSHSHNKYDNEDEEPVGQSFAFIDLLLYIVSGIILIFVMEQFIKIGLLLQ